MESAGELKMILQEAWASKHGGNLVVKVVFILM